MFVHFFSSHLPLTFLLPLLPLSHICLFALIEYVFRAPMQTFTSHYSSDNFFSFHLFFFFFFSCVDTLLFFLYFFSRHLDRNNGYKASSPATEQDLTAAVVVVAAAVDDDDDAVDEAEEVEDGEPDELNLSWLFSLLLCVLL